jgi:hypothetical protein
MNLLIRPVRLSDAEDITEMSRQTEDGKYADLLLMARYTLPSQIK